MRQEKREMIYEGGAKRLYKTEQPEFIIQEFKDDALSPDGKKGGKIKNKGALNNEISSYLFEYLEGFHIPTHFVKQLSDCEMLVKRLEIFPIQLVVRNVSSGNLCSLYKMREGVDLPQPIIEHYLKGGHTPPPLMNEYHIYALGLVSPDELRQLNRLVSKANAVLKSFFERRGFKLVDLKLELGRHDGQILLGDEISPDTCRLWDGKSNKRLDTEHYGGDVGQAQLVYEEIRERVCKKVA